MCLLAAQMSSCLAKIADIRRYMEDVVALTEPNSMKLLQLIQYPVTVLILKQIGQLD